MLSFQTSMVFLVCPSNYPFLFLRNNNIVCLFHQITQHFLICLLWTSLKLPSRTTKFRLLPSYVPAFNYCLPIIYALITEHSWPMKQQNIAHLVNRNAGPSLTPFDATNLNLLKISHLDRTGIPCSICMLNCKQGRLKVSGIQTNKQNGYVKLQGKCCTMDQQVEIVYTRETAIICLSISRFLL